MLELGMALAAVAVVAVAPGALLAYAAAPGLRHDPLLWLVTAPAVTVGIGLLTSQALTWLDLPILPVAPVVLAGGCLLAAALRWWVERRSDNRAPRRKERRSGTTLAGALLLAACAIGGAAWTTALVHLPSEPPGRDGLYHGFFLERIVSTGSIDPAQVLVTDPVTASPAAGFYPLALHDALAGVRSLTGLPAGALITAATMLAATVLLPAAMFCLVRRLVPDAPLVAGFTALSVPFFATFPYQPAAWGGFAVVVGMSMVPAVVALVDRMSRTDDVGVAAVAGLATFGLCAAHTSQAALLLLVVAVQQAVAAVRDDRRGNLRRLRQLSIVGTLAAVLLVPELVAYAGALSERAAFRPTAGVPLSSALLQLARMSALAEVPGQVLLTAVAAVGAVVALRRRILLEWAAVSVVLAALFLAASVPGAPWSWLRPLTSPWYSEPSRLGYHATIVLAVWVGVALDGAVSASDRLTSGRTAPTRHLVVGTVAATAMVVGAVVLLPHGADVVRDGYRSNSVVTAGMRRSFEHLRRHAPTGTILNEERDGSAWMYADAELSPLLAVWAYGSDAGNDERLWLLEHLTSTGDAARVATLLRRWNVRYVLVNDRGFVDEPPRVTAAQLRLDPRFVEVASADGSHVFAVRLPTP